MPTTRHGYAGPGGTSENIHPYGIPHAIWEDSSPEGSVRQAAHAAIRLTAQYGGSSGSHIRATAREFGATIPDTVDCINAVAALVRVPNGQRIF